MSIYTKGLTHSTSIGGTGLNIIQVGQGSLLIGDGEGFKLNTLAAGAGASIVNGDGTITISATGTYVLPIASASVLGGIKVGQGLSIDSGSGVLSVGVATETQLGLVLVDRNAATSTFPVTYTKYGLLRQPYGPAGTALVQVGERPFDNVSTFKFRSDGGTYLGFNVSRQAYIGNKRLVDFQIDGASVFHIENNGAIFMGTPDRQFTPSTSFLIYGNLNLYCDPGFGDMFQLLDADNGTVTSFQSTNNDYLWLSSDTYPNHTVPLMGPDPPTQWVSYNDNVGGTLYTGRLGVGGNNALGALKYDILRFDFDLLNISTLTIIPKLEITPTSIVFRGAVSFPDILTTNGDLLTRAAGVLTRVPATTDGSVLTLSGGLPVWDISAGGMKWKGTWNPLTCYSLNDVVIYNGKSYVRTTTVAYNDVVLADSPVMFWPMTDPSDSVTLEDISASGTHPLSIDSPSVTWGTVPAPTGCGTCAVFDNSEDAAVLITNNSSLEPLGDSPFTIEAWFYLDNGTGNGILGWSFGDGGSHRTVLSCNAHVFRVQYGFTIFTFGGSARAEGQWYYVVVTYDDVSGDLKLYVNNVFIGTEPGLTLDMIPSVLIVGGMHGKLSHVALYPTALTPTRINVHYQAAITDAQPPSTSSNWSAMDVDFAIHAPLVTGELPGPVLMADPLGQCIMVPT